MAPAIAGSITTFGTPEMFKGAGVSSAPKYECESDGAHDIDDPAFHTSRSMEG
jgi:hypothetical protein